MSESRELTVFRATVLEVGVATPRVTVRSLLSNRLVRLQGTNEVISRIARHLHGEVDVHAELVHRPGHPSDEGTIIDFEPLDATGNDVESLSAWVTGSAASNKI